MYNFKVRREIGEICFKCGWMLLGGYKFIVRGLEELVKTWQKEN